MTTWVGRRRRRVEDPALLRGDGVFVGEVAIGTAALRFVRSPIAAGRIIGIDAPEGVTVFTGSDLAGVRPLRPLLHRADFVPIDQPLLATDRVTHVGEPVAVVVGESAEHAEDLAEQVVVDLEPTEPVVDLDAAMAPGAPLVHPHVPGNNIIDARFTTAGVDASFEAAHRVVTVDVRAHRQSAMPLETRGAHAAYDRRTGRVTLTTTSQAPHVVRTAVCDLLGMPEADLRVVSPHVGGGFGQKLALAAEEVVAVWVARRLRASVAWIEDRRENFVSSFHSRDQRHIVSGAFDDHGRLLALDADVRCNVGPYSCHPVTCGVEPLMALAEMPGPYAVAEYRGRARAVASNASPIAPYRGVSRPVITLALERLMDTAAGELGIDPLELRRRNLIREFPHTSPTGLVYDEGSYLEAMELAARMVDLDDFRRRQDEALQAGRYIGIGFSVFSERTGFGTPAFAARGMDITPGYEEVTLSMDPSGYLEARIGASPHGQGLATSLGQLIADRVGIHPDRIRIIHGDTDATPYGWGTFASRSMVIAGGAVHLAAQRLRARLARLAARQLEASVEDIELADGRATVRGTDEGIAISDLARTFYHRSHQLGDDLEPGLTTTAVYDPPGTFSNATHVAEVAVDPETGRVDVTRFVVVEDCGVRINPMIVDGQIHGGVVQGIANALLEEFVYDEEGNPLTTSLMDYLPPTMSEIPRIEIEHLETPSEATITGAKGMGEGGAIGAPAAVINAVSDALAPLGVSVYEMPATPERIRRLLRERAALG